MEQSCSVRFGELSGRLDVELRVTGTERHVAGRRHDGLAVGDEAVVLALQGGMLPAIVVEGITLSYSAMIDGRIAPAPPLPNIGWRALLAPHK